MRDGLFHLQEDEDIQGKNCRFQPFSLKDGAGNDVVLNFKELFGTDALMLDVNPGSRAIQIITKQRYASVDYGGYTLKSQQRSLEKNVVSKDAKDPFFEDLYGKDVYDASGNKCFKILGLKLANPNDRHVVFLLQSYIEPEKLANTFLRFEAKLGSTARGLTEEKQAARWINAYFEGDVERPAVSGRLADYPTVPGNFFKKDTLGSIKPFGVSKGQEISFKNWFDSILSKNDKKYRCFMRADLVGLINLIKSKGYRYIDSFTQADFFILSDELINEIQNKERKDIISISYLNSKIASEDLFPISFKSSTKLNYVGFISDGRRGPPESTGVIDVWQRKLQPLTDTNTKTYAKFWVSGISLFNDKTYTINVRLNIYNVAEGESLDNRHFLVGIQLRSAGDTKCTAETSLKAYTQGAKEDEIVEVDSEGQGGKITNLLPPGDISKGRYLVSEYFNSENGWMLDKKFKTEGKEETKRIKNFQQIGFENSEYTFNSDMNQSSEKTFGLIGFLRGDLTSPIKAEKDSGHDRSDFFFEIKSQNVLDLLKRVYRIQDPQENIGENDENDNSLNYYKWENRKRHQLSLNEKIKIAEAKVRIAKRDLKSLLESR